MSIRDKEKYKHKSIKIFILLSPGGNLKSYVNEKRNSDLSTITNNKPLTDEMQQQQQQLDETSEKRTEHPIAVKTNNLGATEQQQYGSKIPEDEEKKSNDSNTKDNQRQQEEQNNNNNDNDREGRSLTVAKVYNVINIYCFFFSFFF